MNIITKDANIVVLYGDGAVSHFSELVNKWSRMISLAQWDEFQFFLVGPKAPVLDLDDYGKRAVDDRNTVFYKVTGSEPDDDTAPDTSTYHNLIFDKIKTGNVRLHVVYDSGEKEFSSAWLKEFVTAAKSIDVLETTCIYYCVFGINSPAEEREQMLDLVRNPSDSVFLLGNVNENGGRVTQEDRWQATILAILANSACLMPVGRGAYSLGYSALNANGSELSRLADSIACRNLTGELSKTVQTLTGDLELQLLPEDVNAVTGLRAWLTQKVKEKVPQIETNALRNAWITTRMNPDLLPTEAIKRLRRFADLNYTGERVTEIPAKELAWQTEKRILDQLRSSAVTARLSDNIFNEIADALHRIALEDVQPAGCTYPKKPLRHLFGGSAAKEEYAQECKTAVMKSIREYILQKNVCCFAAEMEKSYRKLAAWVRYAVGDDENSYRRPTVRAFLQDCQKELDSSDEGNANRIGQKYKRYAAELEMIHPQLNVLTEGIHTELYQADGMFVEKNWRELIHLAGRNLERRMSPEFRGDFFKVLTSEFSTAEEREKFFDEYLKSGPRMYRHLMAIPSTGTEVLLADDRLTDKWFFGKDLYEVKTDNAENLTVYPLGESTASSFLEDRTVYFKGNNTGTGKGRTLFSSDNRPTERPEATSRPKNSIFGNAGNEKRTSETPEVKQKAGSFSNVRLEPDNKGNYLLYWEWCGNDETAMVEFFQYGEKLGQVAVIPVRRFKDNGNNMNATDEIMGGKQLPGGTLTVTIRAARQNIYIDSAEVQGRRDVIRYKVNNARLQLQPEKRGIMDKVVLRTTETNGNQIFFPLYSGEGEKPWLFEGLTLSDGCIVEDPTQETGLVFPVRVE